MKVQRIKSARQSAPALIAMDSDGNFSETRMIDVMKKHDECNAIRFGKRVTGAFPELKQDYLSGECAW